MAKLCSAPLTWTETPQEIGHQAAGTLGSVDGAVQSRPLDRPGIPRDSKHERGADPMGPRFFVSEARKSAKVGEDDLGALSGT
jgi:hypothetical protein